MGEINASDFGFQLIDSNGPLREGNTHELEAPTCHFQLNEQDKSWDDDEVKRRGGKPML